ncbi:virion core protein, T7 gp14 family
MCDPISLGVISAGLGVAQAVGQYAQQNAAYEAQQQAYNDNKASAQAAFSSEQNTLQQRQLQEQEAEAQRSYDMSQEYIRARETAENSAVDRGQAGLSIEGLLGDIDQQEAERQQRSNKNLEWTLEELQAQKEASGGEMVSRVNSVSKGTKPSFGNLAVGIIGAGMQGFNTYGDAKIRNQRLNS